MKTTGLASLACFLGTPFTPTTWLLCLVPKRGNEETRKKISAPAEPSAPARGHSRRETRAGARCRGRGNAWLRGFPLVLKFRLGTRKRSKERHDRRTARSAGSLLISCMPSYPFGRDPENSRAHCRSQAQLSTNGDESHRPSHSRSILQQACKSHREIHRPNNDRAEPQ